jgi:hypothetical protein
MGDSDSQDTSPLRGEMINETTGVNLIQGSLAQVINNKSTKPGRPGRLGSSRMLRGRRVSRTFRKEGKLQQKSKDRKTQCGFTQRELDFKRLEGWQGDSGEHVTV